MCNEEKCKCNKYKKCKCKNLFTSIIFISLIILIIILLIINISNNNKKDILVTVANFGDNTETGDVIIKFSQNQIVEGSAISHTPDSSEILINEDGIYQISYQLEGDAKSSGTFNFNAVILVNGIPLNETLNVGPVIKEDIINNRMTLTSTVILKLNEGDVVQLGGLSQENIVYQAARIDIEKIG